MRVWNVQIKKKKIDHVPVNKPIGEVSQNAGEQQCKRHISPNVSMAPSHEQRDNDHKRDYRNRDKEAIIVPKRAKRRTGVCDVYQVKETGDQNARLIWVNEPQDQLFRPLIERIERQRNKKNKLHIFVPFLSCRAESPAKP
jgi:hypothetical protein